MNKTKEIMDEIHKAILEGLGVDLQQDDDIYESNIDSFAVVKVMNIVDKLAKENNCELNLDEIFTLDKVSIELIASFFKF